MKLSRKDLKRLRLPIAGCFVLLLGSAGCYYASNMSLQDAKKRAVDIAAQRTEIQGKLSRATEEEREIEANLKDYQALAAHGIIGEEDRLEWVAAATAIKNERRLYDIRYSIEPQKELDYAGFGSAGAIKFMMSRVKLDMQLLHEEDLLNFIDDLGKRGKPYLSPRSCDVRRERSSIVR